MSYSQSMMERVRSSNPFRAGYAGVRIKLLVILLGVAAVPVLLFGMLIANQAEQRVTEQANLRMDSVNAIKAKQVEGYFEGVAEQIASFSRHDTVVKAMRELPSAMQSARGEAHIDQTSLGEIESHLGQYYFGEYAGEYKRRTGVEPPAEAQLQSVDEDSRFLQYLYIASNPNPLGSKAKLGASVDETTYSKLHEKFHPFIRGYSEKFSFSDIYLCDLESGDVVYSLSKKLDFTTSLLDGPYAKSNAGRAFRQAAAAPSNEDFVLVDYEPYLPNCEDPSCFAASAIFEDGRKIGVAIFQLSVTEISGILADPTGLGRSGESLAIGPDNLFRSESRFAGQLDVATAILNPGLAFDVPEIDAALAGNAGSGEATDYRGKPVVSSWTPINIYPGIEGVNDPIRWALMTKVDHAEVTEPLGTTGTTRQLGFVAGLVALLSTVVCCFYTRKMTRSIGSSSDARAGSAKCDRSHGAQPLAEESIAGLIRELEDIADGDLTITIDLRDELTAPITGSLNSMVGQLRGLVQRVKKATDEVNRSALGVREISRTLSKDSVRQSNRITTTSNQIREITESIQSVADKTRQSANVSAKARQSAADGLRVVSDTVEGMQRIRNQVQETSKRIKRLGESSQEIGEIVQLIADIADRTSILALNASIQAAMAGDAGQGFAVVAEEVERLADRSNDATKQIATLIKGIQTETRDAIIDMEESKREVAEGSRLATQAGTTLSEIDQVSAHLADLIADVSSETEIQTGAARKIAVTMGEIAQTTYVNADQSRTAADQVGRLAEFATDLRDSVSEFRVDVHTRTDAAEAHGASLPSSSCDLTEQSVCGTETLSEDDSEVVAAEQPESGEANLAAADLNQDQNALIDPAQYPFIKGAHGFPTRCTDHHSV